MIDYDALKARRFDPVIQSFSARDSRLYALGLNIGADPMDLDGLRYVADDPPLAVPAMAMTLGRLGPWMREPDVGIDYRRIVVGEVALKLHARIPAAADIRGDHRVTRITDKGEGRGALVTVSRAITNLATGKTLAEFEQVTFCRGDGGFAVNGRHDAVDSVQAAPMPDRTPDQIVPMPTALNQALIYRLSGDMNPLHSAPDVARKAGFDRPILHGLATMGMAAHALTRAMSQTGLPDLHHIRARLSAPVVPGDLLTLELWQAGPAVRFRVLSADGREVVKFGMAEFQYMT